MVHAQYVHQCKTCHRLFTVGVTIDKPTSPKAAAVQPDIPTIQTSLAETPKENSSSNPFLNGGMMPHNLHVKQSMTKAKSMVRKCVLILSRESV